MVKFFRKAKDGGPQSTVTGYWLVEIKSLFSIAILRFDHGSREEFHSHAFNALSWILKGRLTEEHLDGRLDEHIRSWRPIVTLRNTFHRVFSEGTTWVLTFRGSWSKTWREYGRNGYTTLAHGRQEVAFDVETHFVAKGYM